MLDGVSLDQLRTFIAAADEGSFSAAGRRLKRAQSVVSQTLANLEGQIGVNLLSVTHIDLGLESFSIADVLHRTAHPFPTTHTVRPATPGG